MCCRLDLVRVEESRAGVFGVLLVDGSVFCLTLEPPDLGNRADISCIPPGRYDCRRVDSPRFGDTFEVAGVPGRSHILFHAGNLSVDTHGCILTGRRFGWVSTARGEGRGVLESRAAFQELLARLSGLAQCELTVHPCPDPLRAMAPPDPSPPVSSSSVSSSLASSGPDPSPLQQPSPASMANAPLATTPLATRPEAGAPHSHVPA